MAFLIKKQSFKKLTVILRVTGKLLLKSKDMIVSSSSSSSRIRVGLCSYWVCVTRAHKQSDRVKVQRDGWYIQLKVMYNIYIVRLPCRLSVLWWRPGDGIQPDLKVLQGTSIYNWRWYSVPFPDASREEGILVCVFLGSDLSDLMVSSCSGVPCCVIFGWFNGNQLMVDLVAHYKGLFPSSLLEGFPLKTV